jgi:hypothetical protein
MKPDGDTETVATLYEGAAPENQPAHDVNRRAAPIRTNVDESVRRVGSQERRLVTLSTLGNSMGLGNRLSVT